MENEDLKREILLAAENERRLKQSVRLLTEQLKQSQDNMTKVIQNNTAMKQEIRKQTAYIERIKEIHNRCLEENNHLRRTHGEQMRKNSGLWEQNKELRSLLSETRDLLEQLNAEVRKLRTQPLASKLITGFKQKLDESEEENKRLKKENIAIKEEYEARLVEAKETIR